MYITNERPESILQATKDYISQIEDIIRKHGFTSKFKAFGDSSWLEIYKWKFKIIPVECGCLFLSTKHGGYGHWIDRATDDRGKALFKEIEASHHKFHNMHLSLRAK